MISEISKLEQTPIFPSEQGMDPMANQLCRVCEEKAAGFHFGAFTCEGCKSFFGRFCNNQTNIPDCKNNYRCVIDKRNRTSCKACRLRKCLSVGMSKSGCRYGRRSNWFKIHCLMQKNAASAAKTSAASPSASLRGLTSMMASQTPAPTAKEIPRPMMPMISPLKPLNISSSRSPSPLNTSSSETSESSPVPESISPVFNPFTSLHQQTPPSITHPNPFPLIDPLAIYRLSPLMALQPLLNKSSNFHEHLRLLAERRALFEATCANLNQNTSLTEDSKPIDLSVK